LGEPSIDDDRLVSGALMTFWGDETMRELTGGRDSQEMLVRLKDETILAHDWLWLAEELVSGIGGAETDDAGGALGVGWEELHG